MPAEPPRLRSARQFLARRGGQVGKPGTALHGQQKQQSALARVTPMGSSTKTWAALGPLAVVTTSFGAVTGRVSALAVDPSDATGNRLFVGTTGGGVWASGNAATSNPAILSFKPITDNLSALNGATDASLSIGALTVQPGSTGVILAGTGDGNDMLDSYYGAGILRSEDGGTNWTLVTGTSDIRSGYSTADFTFVGESFAGFAWSTVNSQLVVAAVSEAYESTAVAAEQTGSSYRGLYYSVDAGKSWHLATLQDGTVAFEGPLVAQALPNGNAVTSLVWNPVRSIFIAAVRYHGYYQSSDGKIWTRMSSQPGSALTSSNCPSRVGSTGSTGCPIYRGTLAVNPKTGDTFAWTVDRANVDQGLWQDHCSALANGGQCTTQSVSFSTQLSTTALEQSVSGSAHGILNGSYTLALAAIPQNQDTILLAGDDDLWRCSLAMGCVWRNTTNTDICQGAGVAAYQHAIAWSAANPQEIFIGNDSGLWRSMDAVGVSGTACSAADATHFQNLNASLGSLADVESLSAISSTPYTLLAGLGVNGAAGVKASSTVDEWPQVLGGYGGVVAVDTGSSGAWYVNDQPGVAIYGCQQSGACTPADFGSSPAIRSAQVGDDGSTMDLPAQFLVDPLDTSQLLIGTCRVWRGPASGAGWSSTNALSAVLDGGSSTGKCLGDGLIGAMAAMPLASGEEEVVVGMRGTVDEGGVLAGHVLKAQFKSTVSGSVVWTDLTYGSVTNDTVGLNPYNMGISSVFLDPHDTTGQTIYITVAIAQQVNSRIQTVYRTTNGGSSWMNLTADLPQAPANAVRVDPQDAGTVYVATDQGVYSTSNLAACAGDPYVCWTQYGSGLPLVPVVALSSTPAGVSDGALVAATWGRGIWTTSLASAGSTLTTATALPSQLDFGSIAVGSMTATQTVALTNTGTQLLTPTAITVPASYTKQDNCEGKAFATGASCTIQVAFAPTTSGAQNGLLRISANISGGEISVVLTGTGLAPGVLSMTPVLLDFGSVVVGSSSPAQSVMANNTGGAAVSMTSTATSLPFVVALDQCSGNALAGGSACQIKVIFSPTAAGAANATLAVADSAGTQMVRLSGTGILQATDTLSATALLFPSVAVGTRSAAQMVTLTNGGGLPLQSIALSLGGTAASQFQQSSTCGGQLAAGASCAISVIFAPSQVGGQTATLTVTDVLQTQVVQLNGTAVATPTLRVVPSSLTFTNQTVGVASAAQTVTVTNAGALPIDNIGTQLTGAAASSYSLTNNTCGSTLAAGASCSMGVVFTPSATGQIAALLSITSSTANVAAVSVPINGYALVTGGLTATPSALSFGTVSLGQSAATQTLTFTNGTGYAIVAPSLTVSGPFTLAGSTCTGTLSAAATCSVSVSFVTSAAGSFTGAITATSATLAQPLTVALSGSVFDFSVALSGQSGQSVAAGQTASYTFTITAAAGLTGSYSYSYLCGTLPSYAVCSFNPASSTTAAGTAAYVTLTLSTGKTSGALQGIPALWLEHPLSYAILVIPFVRIRRQARPACWLALLLVLIVLSGCALAELASNGKGGSGGTATTTPTGSYTIPVTVTSGGLSHTVNVTLTVL